MSPNSKNSSSNPSESPGSRNSKEEERIRREKELEEARKEYYREKKEAAERMRARLREEFESELEQNKSNPISEPKRERKRWESEIPTANIVDAGNDETEAENNEGSSVWHIGSFDNENEENVVQDLMSTLETVLNVDCLEEEAVDQEIANDEHDWNEGTSEITEDTEESEYTEDGENDVSIQEADLPDTFEPIDLSPYATIGEKLEALRMYLEVKNQLIASVRLILTIYLFFF